MVKDTMEVVPDHCRIQTNDCKIQTLLGWIGLVG